MAPTPKRDVYQGLESTEKAWFLNQSDRLRRAYQLGNQQNTYDRDLSKSQYTWDRQDLVKRLADARTQIPGQYNRRGLMDSGLQQRGLIDFNSERSKSLGRIDQANALKTGGFNMVGNQLKRVYTESAHELARQREALRAMRAETAVRAQTGWFS